MKKTILFTFFVFTLLAACKNEPKAPVNPPTPITATAPETPTAPIKKIEGLQQEKPLSAHAIQFYTNLLWHYSAAVVIGDPEKSKSYTGKWIQFKPDNTIETGFYDGPINTGSWIVDEAKNVLTIVENGERPTYSEWTIKTSSVSDAVMVWVGTPRFGLNNTQIKMSRYSTKPAKAE